MKITIPRCLSTPALFSFYSPPQEVLDYFAECPTRLDGLTIIFKNYDKIDPHTPSEMDFIQQSLEKIYGNASLATSAHNRRALKAIDGSYYFSITPDYIRLELHGFYFAKQRPTLSLLRKELNKLLDDIEYSTFHFSNIEICRDFFNVSIEQLIPDFLSSNVHHNLVPSHTNPNCFPYKNPETLACEHATVKFRTSKREICFYRKDLELQHRLRLIGNSEKSQSNRLEYIRVYENELQQFTGQTIDQLRAWTRYELKLTEAASCAYALKLFNENEVEKVEQFCYRILANASENFIMFLRPVKQNGELSKDKNMHRWPKSASTDVVFCKDTNYSWQNICPHIPKSDLRLTPSNITYSRSVGQLAKSIVLEKLNKSETPDFTKDLSNRVATIEIALASGLEKKPEQKLNETATWTKRRMNAPKKS